MAKSSIQSPAQRAGLHVGINAQLISSASNYRSAGVSNYSRHLLAALGELVQEGITSHHFTAFLHAEDVHAPGIELRRGNAQLEQPAMRIAWEQGVLPWKLKQIQADVVHGLVNVLPLRTQKPGVVTVHDLSFLRLPDLFPAYKRAYMTALCRASVARAEQIVAVSHQTANDLVQLWHVDRKRLFVAPNGVDARFSPGTPEQDEAFRRTHNLPERYWLYLGTLEPRKNLPMLLHAFARWREKEPAEVNSVHLIIAGGKGWYYDTIFSEVAALGLTEWVHFPGFIPNDELPAWYRAAELFVYPSRYEGFGLPVIEAMACGTPVLCSNAPGVHEVAGHAAVQLPADDVDAWVAALSVAATQPELRAALHRCGLTQAHQFAWRHAALLTVEAYERAANKTRNT
jgi:glycosyltransferase involved in cell wall biosynthesis